MERIKIQLVFGNKKSKKKYFMYNRYEKYGSYDIYSTDPIYDEARNKSYKYHDWTVIVGMLAFFVFIASFIIFGLNIGEEGNGSHSISLFAISGGLMGLFIGLVIIAFMLNNVSNRQWNIYKIFDKSFNVDKAITKQEAKLKDLFLKKKAENLITVYDTLDDKDMQKEKKIDIIKNYMKED